MLKLLDKKSFFDFNNSFFIEIEFVDKSKKILKFTNDERKNLRDKIEFWLKIKIEEMLKIADTLYKNYEKNISKWDDLEINNFPKNNLPSHEMTIFDGRILRFDDLLTLKNFITMFGLKFAEMLIALIDPNFSHIEKKGQLYTIVNKNEDRISFKDLSYGTKKILKILIHIKKNMKNRFILVDEIENGFNLSLLNLLFMILDEFDIQVISTTHNTLILDRNIISAYNAMIYRDDKKTFIKAHDALNKKRPENLKSLFKPSNYHNEFQNITATEYEISTNSISNIKMNELLDSINM